MTTNSPKSELADNLSKCMSLKRKDTHFTAMTELAIRGGKPLRDKPFPIWPIVGEEEKKAVAKVVESGTWGHLGGRFESKIEEFREKFAKYYGVDYAIPVTSGSSALEVALRNAGVGCGDEVITPATTWVASNLAPLIVGAETVFVDVSPDNYCIDPERVEEAITPKTKAIIPVHIGGYPCEMKSIMEIAESHNLIVIEDCAQAHGTRYEGKLVGAFGSFGCFSFERSKLMTAGEGGMVITNDENLGEYVFGVCGEGGQQPTRIFAKGRKNVGWNYRMTEMQASILLAQLSRLDDHKRRRIENAEYLKKRLSEIEGVEPCRQYPEQNYYSYILKYNPDHFKGVSKWKFMEALSAEGIQPTFSSPSHQHPAYKSPNFIWPRKDYSKIYCPVAEKAYNVEAIGLGGTRVLLGEREDMDDIIDAIVKIKKNIDELIH